MLRKEFKTVVEIWFKCNSNHANTDKYYAHSNFAAYTTQNMALITKIFHTTHTCSAPTVLIGLHLNTVLINLAMNDLRTATLTNQG